MGIKRRILLVTFGTVILCAMVIGVLASQHRKLERELRLQRDQAVAAVAEGRYIEARGPLENYLHREGVAGDDFEAMMHLAHAIVSVPTANRSDRVQAMRLFARVAAQAPANVPVRRRLLELQAEFGFHDDVLATADELLARAHDADTLRRARRLKVEALLALQHHEPALDAVREAIAADPTSVSLHRLALEVLHAGPWPAAALLDHARSDRWFDSGDVRRDALLAVAHRLAGDVNEANRVLDRCLARALPDAATAHLVVEQLEALDRFDDALATLERAAAALAEPSLEVALAHRHWQRNGAEAVRRQLAHHQAPTHADGAELSADLVALHAKALLRDGQDGEAQAWIDALRRRSASDAAAAAWSIYLTGVFDHHTTVEAVIRRCRQALARDESNAYVHFALAEALASRGERIAALIHWRAAASASPAWAEPRLRAARVLTELGLVRQAQAMAQAGHRRVAPDDLAARIVVVEAQRLELAAERTSVAELLERVSAIQRELAHEPRTLALYVHLLAEQNRREDAGEALLAALDRALPEATLLSLARVSRAHGLGLADACYAQSEALHGRTPALAYSRALDDHQRGRAERALTHFQPLEDEHHPPTDHDGPELRVRWQLAHARFLDHTRRNDAADAWRSLLQEHPESLTVHLAAVDAEVVRGDRDLMRRAVEGLRELTGEASVTWRLAKGRWLLNGESIAPERATEAALVLGEARRQAPWLIEARLWLARALVRLDEPEAAIAQLRAATAHEPDDQPALLELARLLTERGDEAEALAQLNRVVNNRASSVSQLQEAAAMLVQLRGWDEAVAALTRAAEAGGRTPGELLLVGLGEERAADTEQADDEPIAR